MPGLLAQTGVVIAGAFVFIAAIYGLALWTSYGWMANAQYRVLERKGLVRDLMSRGAMRSAYCKRYVHGQALHVRLLPALLAISWGQEALTCKE